MLRDVKGSDGVARSHQTSRGPPSEAQLDGPQRQLSPLRKERGGAAKPMTASHSRADVSAVLSGTGRNTGGSQKDAEHYPTTKKPASSKMQNSSTSRAPGQNIATRPPHGSGTKVGASSARQAKSSTSKRMNKSSTLNKHRKLQSHLSPDLEEVYKGNEGDTASNNYGGPSPHSPVELDDNDIHSLNLNESCSGDDDERSDRAGNAVETARPELRDSHGYARDMNDNFRHANVKIKNKIAEAEYSEREKFARMNLPGEPLSSAAQKEAGERHSKPPSVHTQARPSFDHHDVNALKNSGGEPFTDQESSQTKQVRGSMSSYNTGQMASHVYLQTHLGSNKKSVFKKISGAEGCRRGFNEPSHATENMRPTSDGVPIYISTKSGLERDGTNASQPHPIKEIELSRGSLYRGYSRFLGKKPADLSATIQSARQKYQEMQGRQGRRRINFSSKKPADPPHFTHRQLASTAEGQYGNTSRSSYRPTIAIDRHPNLAESVAQQADLIEPMNSMPVRSTLQSDHPSISKNYPKSMLDKLRQRRILLRREGSNCKTQRLDKKPLTIPPVPKIQLQRDDRSDHVVFQQTEATMSTVTDDLDLGKLRKQYNDSLEARYQARVVDLYRTLKREYEGRYGFAFSSEDEMVKFLLGMGSEFNDKSEDTESRGPRGSKTRTERDATAISHLTSGEWHNSQSIPSWRAQTLASNQPHTIRLNHRDILDGQAQMAQHLFRSGPTSQQVDRPSKIMGDLEKHLTKLEETQRQPLASTGRQVSQGFALATEQDAAEATDSKLPIRWNQLGTDLTQRQLGRYLQSDRARLEEEGRQYTLRNKIKKAKTAGTRQATTSRSKVVSPRVKVSQFDIFSENNEDFDVSWTARPPEDPDDKELSQMVHDLRLPDDQDHRTQSNKEELGIQDGEEQPEKAAVSAAEDEVRPDLNLFAELKPCSLSRRELALKQELLGRYEQKKWSASRSLPRSRSRLSGKEEIVKRINLCNVDKIMPANLMGVPHSTRIMSRGTESDLSRPLHPRGASLGQRRATVHGGQGEESQDQRNADIVKFCTLLFQIWLSDYGNYVEKVKEANTMQTSYQLNECARKNIEEQCLPLDYFIERMLQLGLCRNLPQIKELLKIMEGFDSPGTQIITDPSDGGRVCSYFERHFVDQHAVVSDDFKLINAHNTRAEAYIRNNLDRRQFEKFDRVSITQFLSLFNVHGVKQGRMLDKIHAAMAEMASTTEHKPKQAGRPAADQKRKPPTRPYKPRPLSADSRRLIGLAVSLLDKKHMLKRVDEGQFMLAQKCKDHTLYNQVRTVFSELILSADYLQRLQLVKKLRAARRGGVGTKSIQTQKDVADVERQERLGASIYSKEVVLDTIRDVTLATEEGSTGPRLRSCMSEEERQAQAASFFSDFFKEDAEVKAVRRVLPWAQRSKGRVRQRQLAQDLRKAIAKEMRASAADLSLRRRIREVERQRRLHCEFNDQFKQLCREAHERMDVMSKQLLLNEICRDVVIITQIIVGIITFDTAAEAKGNDAIARADKAKKENYKLLFRQYVMRHIRRKYANQCDLFIHPDHKQSLDLSTLAEFEAQGVKARGILIEICGLLMREGVILRYDISQDWYAILSANERVCHLVNHLINLMQDQIHCRAQHNRLPNEDFDSILAAGKKIWAQVDPDCTQCVPRRRLDAFLLDKKIVSDSREVPALLRGVLNGQVVSCNDTLKKSQFYGIVYKAVLRQAVLNILNHMMTGQDIENTSLSGMVQRLQRKILNAGIKTKNTKDGSELERAKAMSEDARLVFGGPESYSQSCVEVVDSLQKLKDDPRQNKDKCQIAIDEHKAWLRKNRVTLQMKNAVLVDFKQLEFGNRARPNSPRALAARFSNFGRRFPPERQAAIKQLIIKEVPPEEESQVSTHKTQSVLAKRDGGVGDIPESRTAAQVSLRTSTQPMPRKERQPAGQQTRPATSATIHRRTVSLPRFFRQIQKLKLNKQQFQVPHAVSSKVDQPAQNTDPDELALENEEDIKRSRPRVSLLERQSDANAAARALMGMASKINANKIN